MKVDYVSRGGGGGGGGDSLGLLEGRGGGSGGRDDTLGLVFAEAKLEREL